MKVDGMTLDECQQIAIEAGPDSWHGVALNGCHWIVGQAAQVEAFELIAAAAVIGLTWLVWAISRELREAPVDLEPYPITWQDCLHNARAAVARVMLEGDTRPGRRPSDWLHRHDVPAAYFEPKIQRHMQAYLARMRKDPDSGEHPLAHAAACMLMLLECELRWPEGRCKSRRVDGERCDREYHTDDVHVFFETDQVERRT